MPLSTPYPLRTLALTLAAVTLLGCGETARLQREAGYGPTPTLPEPHKTLLPTINVAPAVGWPEGGKPTAAPGPWMGSARLDEFPGARRGADRFGDAQVRKAVARRDDRRGLVANHGAEVLHLQRDRIFAHQRDD